VNTIAILGAGDLAATLACRIAEAQLARCVVMVDAIRNGCLDLYNYRIYTSIEMLSPTSS